MSKSTLLSIVQGILSDSDGDEVNSIADTIESQQCADLVADVFDQIVEQYDLHLHEQTIRLSPTSSSTPTVMTRPEGFHDIQWVKYDKKVSASDPQAYQDVRYFTPKEFMDRTSQRNLSDSTVTASTLATSSHVILVRNDVAPTFYTVLDGYDDLVFDAYDSALETNLQNSKSLAYGTQLPTLTVADGSVPNLPQHMMVLLRREARAMYFDLYKDGITVEVDRTRRRAETRAQRQRRIIKNQDNQTGPNFGRK